MVNGLTSFVAAAPTPAPIPPQRAPVAIAIPRSFASGNSYFSYAVVLTTAIPFDIAPPPTAAPTYNAT